MFCSRYVQSFLVLGLLFGGMMAKGTRAADEKGPQLPLKKVVMFSSGVGYFERRGDVEGNAKVELKFNVRDINDLLKSLVLQDLGGGQISTVTYASKDPITRTLQSFAIDLTANPTLSQLLDQVRGVIRLKGLGPVPPHSRQADLSFTPRARALSHHRTAGLVLPPRSEAPGETGKPHVPQSEAPAIAGSGSHGKLEDQRP